MKIECSYCLADIENNQINGSDAEYYNVYGWEKAIDDGHSPDCEWVRTKAHTSIEEDK